MDVQSKVLFSDFHDVSFPSVFQSPCFVMFHTFLQNVSFFIYLSGLPIASAFRNIKSKARGALTSILFQLSNAHFKQNCNHPSQSLITVFPLRIYL